MRRVGSTDISSIVAHYVPGIDHLAKKKNISDTWLRIVHNVEIPRSGVMGRGLKVEPLLRDLYREHVGECVEIRGVVQHPKHEWMTGSPDGVSGDDILVELKTCSNWIRNRWGASGTDELPQDYQLQVTHLLEVAGRKTAHVLCAFGFDGKDDAGEPTFEITETAVYFVRHDPALVAMLVSLGERFWREHVLTKTPPPVKPKFNRTFWNKLLKSSKEQQNGKAENRRQVDELESTLGSPDAG